MAASFGSSLYHVDTGAGSPTWDPQPVGASAGTSQAKQLTERGHSPTPQQTGCLKVP